MLLTPTFIGHLNLELLKSASTTFTFTAPKIN